MSFGQIKKLDGTTAPSEARDPLVSGLFWGTGPPKEECQRAWCFFSFFLGSRQHVPCWLRRAACHGTLLESYATIGCPAAASACFFASNQSQLRRYELCGQIIQPWLWLSMQAGITSHSRCPWEQLSDTVIVQVGFNMVSCTFFCFNKI